MRLKGNHFGRCSHRETSFDLEMSGKSFGEIALDLEKSGNLGHFKSCSLFRSYHDKDKLSITRDFWLEAGVNASELFVQYLGKENIAFENINEATVYIRLILDKLTKELIFQIKRENTDLMLKKLFMFYEDTYAFYIKDREVRTECSVTNSNETLENNRNITLTLLDGLNIMIENCVVFQNENKDLLDNSTDYESEDQLFDSNLFLKVYLYSLLSQNYTLLNLSKSTSRNCTFCKGIKICPYEVIPINSISYHPILYYNYLIGGNQNALVPKDEVLFYMQQNDACIGKGFQNSYNIGFLQVMASLEKLKEKCLPGKAMIMSLNRLKQTITSSGLDVNPDNLIKYFSISNDKLKSYISDKEPNIFRVGSNEYRLEIRPIVLLDNDTIYLSSAILANASNKWFSLVSNGGKPYTGVNVGQGDFVIDGFAQREKDIGSDLVNIIYKKLENHYPDAMYKNRDVQYDRIFGKKSKNYGDFDIVFYAGDELFLIEAKYFSDSPTINLLMGDYNKLFKDGGYYMHCRARYDLVEQEHEKMKKFINASGKIKAHYLFVSSKPLEVEFQDEDKMLTFLCLDNFDKYIEGKFESEDGHVLRPTHEI